MIEKLDMCKIQNTWLVDIMNRIQQTAVSSKYSDEEKIVAIIWLTKQAIKAEED